MANSEPIRQQGWLVVEDETLIAFMIEEAIAEMGLRSIGPAPSVAKALALLQVEAPAGAVLDVNLAGEVVYPVAEALTARGIPYAFLTGYGEGGIRDGYRTHPVIPKPFAIEDIQKTIRSLQSGIETRQTA